MNNYFKKSIVKWAIIIAIGALAYGLMYYVFFYNKGSYNLQQNQDDYLNQVEDDNMVNWKEYSNGEGGFTLRYPASWTIDDKTSEGSLDYGPPKAVTFTGRQGVLQVQYGTGFGGMCEEGYEPLIIGSEKFDVCRSVADDVERWDVSAKNLGKFGLGMLITINKPYISNRDIVIKILSTFKLIKQ